MKIYAISDLHLSGENVTKPMDIFGSYTTGYIEEVKKNWDATVEDGDIVLVSGDISWAMYLEGAKPDLDFIGKLKGTKILIRGNHDYWWKSISNVRAVLHESIKALQNDSIRIGQAVICGTRGWTVPELADNKDEDIKIYNREVERLKLSLIKAVSSREEGDVLICMTHFPPFNSAFEDSNLCALFSEYKVNKVVFGHLHGSNIQTPLYHVRNNIEYYLTSCDKVNNNPVRIL